MIIRRSQLTQRDTRRGFTLIELLVVVLIIGILAAIALPPYQKAVEKARASEALSILRNIAEANRLYFMANGEYTWSLDQLDIEIPGKDIIYQSMDRKETKYFQYGASWFSRENPKDIIALANRIPNGSNYALVMYADQTGIFCYAYSQQGLTNCKMLGAISATTLNTFYPLNL